MNLRTCLIVSCAMLGLLEVGPKQQKAASPPVVKVVMVNAADAAWERDSSGADSVTLRQDPLTGATELFARYPAGHVFPPHWHSANERIVLFEGRMSIRDGGVEKFLDPGGFAFLPAKVPQQMACVSSTRCGFYVHWDGKLDFNKVSSRQE